MIQINLLPIRELKRRAKAKKELVLAGLIVGAFLALLALFGIFLVTSVKNLQAELATVKKEKQSYDAKLKDLEKLEKEKEDVLKRISIIEQLEAAGPTTVHVLDDVASRTPPDRIWLTDVNKTGSSVQVNGMSLDNQTVAKYMLDLEDSPYMSNLTLVKTDTKKYAERELKAFSLRSSITVPKADKSEEGRATSQK